MEICRSVLFLNKIVWGCALISFFSFNAFSETEPIFQDRTEFLLKYFSQKKNDEKPETTELIFKSGVSTAAGFQIKLYNTVQARKLIESKTFDVTDNDFDEEAFYSFLFKEFESALEFYSKLNLKSNIREIHLMVVDYAEDRNTTISLTKINSRALLLDIRRWHKIYKGYRYYLGSLSATHELAHVFNYFSDNLEEKLYREFVAVVFESIRWIEIYGYKSYEEIYLQKTSSGKPKEEEVDQGFDEAAVLSGLKHLEIESKVLTIDMLRKYLLELLISKKFEEPISLDPF